MQHSNSTTTKRKPTLEGRFKPHGRAYVPPTHERCTQMIHHYLHENKGFSKELSESRRQQLKRTRNLKKFTYALFPFIEERYDMEIAKKEATAI